MIIIITTPFFKFRFFYYDNVLAFFSFNYLNILLSWTILDLIMKIKVFN